MADFDYIMPGPAPVKLVSIIRPFGQPDIRPPPTYVKKAKEEPNEDEDLVVWGNSGNSIFALQATSKSDIKPQESDEISRKYDVVRVKNPDDPDQYIETERMTEYQARNKIDGSRITLRFEKTQASENIEIVKKDQTRKAAE